MNPLNYMRLHDYSSRNSRQHWINASNGKIRHAYESPGYGRMQRWAPGLRFDRARRIPEREPRIDPIRIALQHLVVERSRGRRRLGYAVEIADVLPGLFNDLGAVVVPRSLMSGDHRAWGERLDGVERSDPLTAGLRV